MTNTQKHAKSELDILIKNQPDSYIIDFQDEILAICEKFGKSGQSGGSAPYVVNDLADIIKKLCLSQTITPIYNNENEWVEVAVDSTGEPLYQNSRNGAIFKSGKYGQAYYLDAIVKRNQDGELWHGDFWLNKEQYLIGDDSLSISSKAYIKSFPFEPKTFYIDVIEEEIAPNDCESWCKDDSQLIEVWNYYDKYKY